MSASPAFAFVQFELPYPPGPAAGRYLVREYLSQQASHVVVLNEITTTPRRQRWPRAQREHPNPEPLAVSVWRLTVVDASPTPPEQATPAALRDLDHRALVTQAAARAERLFDLHAIASRHPPSARRLTHDSLAIRVGFGAGAQVAEGRWSAAVRVPTRSADDEPSLEAQQRLASLLAGSDAALTCERFTLRARADLAAQRTREAAITADAAVRTALAELPAWKDQTSLTEHLHALQERASDIARIAEAACHGGLAPEEVAVVGGTLDALQSALRVRRAS